MRTASNFNLIMMVLVREDENSIKFQPDKRFVQFELKGKFIEDWENGAASVYALCILMWRSAY